QYEDTLSRALGHFLSVIYDLKSSIGTAAALDDDAHTNLCHVVRLACGLRKPHLVEKCLEVVGRLANINYVQGHSMFDSIRPFINKTYDETLRANVLRSVRRDRLVRLMREIREAHGISQQEIANRMEMARDHYRHIEAGRRPVPDLQRGLTLWIQS